MKVWYYLKKCRFNVFINAINLIFFSSSYNKNFKKLKQNFTPLIFPTFEMSAHKYPCSVSIVIPVYNQWNFTYMCLKSILENTKDYCRSKDYNEIGDINCSYEIIIADDKSSDETVNIEKYVKNVKIIRNKNNLGFIKNCNNAAEHASGKYILFLNNDTKVQKDWLNNLLLLIEKDKSIGMVGPKFIYPNGVLLEAGGIIWQEGDSWQFGRLDNPNRPEYNYIKEADYISGACIMIRKELFKDIGGFDERYAPAYYEDADLAFEVRKRGYKVVYQPKSLVIHYENVTYGKKKAISKNRNNIRFNDDAKNENNNVNVCNKEKFKQKWDYELKTLHYKHMTNIAIIKNRNKYYL